MKHLAGPRAARCISVSIFADGAPSGRRLVEHGSWNLALALRGDFRLLHGAGRLELAESEVVLLRRSGLDAGYLEVASTARPERPALLWASFCDMPWDSEREPAPQVIHLAVDEVAGDAAIRSVLALLEGELALGSAESRRLARSLADALFAYVARRAARRSANDADARPPRLIDRQIARALELFEAKPGSRWTLASLAKAAGLSRAQFSRRFVAALGAPPLRYVAARRLQLAAELLSDGDDSLAGIATYVGYESEFAFSRAFKRFAGVAPGSFRRRMRTRPGVTLALAA